MTALALAIGAAAVLSAAAPAAAARSVMLAQAMVPPTGMGPAGKAMAAAAIAAAERMRRRFPQPVRVGDLIGLPLLDDNERTLGSVRQLVRTPQNRVELIVAYGGFLGWGSRLVAVPIEVVGIEGRQLVSLDMPRSDYAAAPTWRASEDRVIADDDIIRVALARH